MKKRNRVLAILAVLALAFAFSGCTKNQSEEPAAPEVTLPEGAVAFENLLGTSGYYVDEENGEWHLRTYYMQQDGEDVPIAQSFGFGEAEDYAIDVDGEQWLVCNCTFGGDGAERVYVYKLEEGVPVMGQLLDEELIPEYTGVTPAVIQEYLPEDEVFYVGYPDEDGDYVDCYFSTDELIWGPIDFETAN